MSEDAARKWIEDRWGRDAIDQLGRYAELIRSESQQQNLIARSTLEAIWHRHFLDSAQLVPLADDAGEGEWIDIGSGAGLPGIVVAILQKRPVRMIEPRRMRVSFLEKVVAALGLNATVEMSNIETSKGARSAGVISARAVASLDRLLEMAAPIATSDTILVFPKGRSGVSELEQIAERWKGMFHVEQSLTAPDSIIVVARGVTRR